MFSYGLGLQIYKDFGKKQNFCSTLHYFSKIFIFTQTL